MRIIFYLFWVVCLVRFCDGAVIANGKLEQCLKRDEDEMDCEERFIISLTAQNGEDGTSAIELFRFDSASDDEGNKLKVLDTVSIALRKSQVRLRYPLVYEQDFNHRPHEAIKYRDGDILHALFNPCDDSESGSATCGQAKDSEDNAVPFSQGFCCKCSASSFLPIGSSKESRGNLGCDLFSTSGNTQSAHCPLMDPLWWSGYSIKAPVVEYTINVLMEKCKNSSAGMECENAESIEVGPHKPGACFRWNDNKDATHCDLQVTLQGDFAAFESPPQLSSKILLVPSQCSIPSFCESFLWLPVKDWLLIDRDRFTFNGRECDKIGSSYEAFFSQGNKCRRPRGSCFQDQPKDFFEEDAKRLAEDKLPRFRVRSVLEGSTQLGVNDEDGELSLVFDTQRFQKTLLALSVDADSIRSIRNIATGKIVKANIDDFEALKEHGELEVSAQNTGSVPSQFSLAINCTAGVSSIPAREFSLDPGASEQFQFVVRVESEEERVHWCTVTLFDAIFDRVDTVHVNVTARGLEKDKGAQEGDNPDREDEYESDSGSSDCTDVCGFLNLICNLSTMCWGNLLWWVLLFLALFCCIPCMKKCCLRCCKSVASGGGEKNSTETVQKVHYYPPNFHRKKKKHKK